MGLRPCSTSQRWSSIPTWNLNLQLRCIAIQKWRQQRPRICSVRSLCVASVALASYLHAWVVFHRYAVVPSLFLLFVCVCVCVCFFVYHDDILCWLLSCPVLFCLLSLLISELFSGLISFGSVYFVTTAGFDELCQFLFSPYDSLLL